MKIIILPKKSLSKWSFWFIVVTFIAFALFFILTNVFNQKGGDTFFSNPLLTIPMLLAFASSFLAFATGLYSIIFYKGRSITVFLTTLIGLFISLLGFMQVFS